MKGKPDKLTVGPITIWDEVILTSGSWLRSDQVYIRKFVQSSFHSRSTGVADIMKDLNICT